MFIPKKIVFEKGTLDYEMGKDILRYFQGKKDVSIVQVPFNQLKSVFAGDTLAETYQNGKQLLVVSKKKAGAFQTCKPSADYMLPLVSGCMGQCHYCYLHTQLGDKPFVRVNVNLDDIYDKAKKYMDQKEEVTSFEGSATSDPLCVEPYTHTLLKAIEFFAKEDKGRFRFVTKYSDVDSLVNLDHRGKTEVRFSINTDRVRDTFEHYTATIDARIHAAVKMMKAGYPVGFLIAPVFLYENWREEYQQLIYKLKDELPEKREHPLYFEVITHRYTSRAKEQIEQIFPENQLPMNDEERQFKYGQFGYGKFVYKKEDMQDVKAFFQQKLKEAFPECDIKYIV